MFNYDPLGSDAAIQSLGIMSIPSDAHAVITKPGLTPAEQYAAYVASLAPLLWLRLRETTGTAAVNSGSAGVVGDGVNTAATIGQTGKLGANEAYDYDGATSLITIATNAAFNALSTWTYACLVKGDTVGEGNAGTFFSWGAASNFSARLQAALSVLRCSYGTGAAVSTTVTTSGLTAGVWGLVFFTFSLAGDKKIRTYVGAGGTVTEPGYSTQTDLAVAVPDLSAQNLVIGNRDSINVTWDGLFDEFYVWNRVLSATEMAQMTTLSGV